MPEDMVKSQVENLEKTILELVRGNFNSRVPVGEEGNEINALATGINILVEELQATTVSTITLEKYLDDVLNALLAIMNLDFKHQLPIGDTESPLSAISQAINITSQEMGALISEITLQRDFVENIIKSMIDTLVVIGPDAKIKTINKATSDLLDYKEDELVGKPVATIFAEEELFEGPRMKKLIDDGFVRDYDMTYKTKSGEKIPVSFSGSVMYGSSESGVGLTASEVQSPKSKVNISSLGHRTSDFGLRTIVGIVGIARDMREIKRLMEKEKELALAAVAAAAEKKKAEELAGMNEELTTTNEELQSTTEELRQTNEELQSTTEELRQTNEELNTTNEELEASSEELLKTNEEVKQSAEVWQRTFDSITDLVFLQNNDFIITRVNKSFAEAIKMKPEDIVGKKCYEVLHKSDKPWPNCPFAKTKTDNKYHLEEVNDSNIGIPLLVSSSPVFDAQGKLTGSVHIARDITAIKESENEIKEKIHELEVFQKAAVNRELKMIELKNRIKELEGKQR